MRIVQVIAGLGSGGAEMMLYRLLSVWDRRNDQIAVVSLTDRGVFGDKIEKLGISVHTLEMRRGRPSFSAALRLARWLRRWSPQLIQCWMYHADLVGGLATRLAGAGRVVWGIHNSFLDPNHSKRTTIWTARLCAWLSHWVPDRVICCSRAASDLHQAMGYRADKIVIIPNGFDVSAFKPDAQARASVRAELGIPADAVVIGLSARFDPQKDHRNFIQAAGILADKGIDAFFVLCGEGVCWDNAGLSQWASASRARERFRLLGRREDMPRIAASLDISAVSSAYGEAFPLVVGEAMACGVPCVVTDIGDSRFLVGNTGRVVPPKDPHALADAWHKLIEMGPDGRGRLGQLARQRIKERFDLGMIAARYAAVYREVAQARNE